MSVFGKWFTRKPLVAPKPAVRLVTQSLQTYDLKPPSLTSADELLENFKLAIRTNGYVEVEADDGTMICYNPKSVMSVSVVYV